MQVSSFGMLVVLGGRQTEITNLINERKKHRAKRVCIEDFSSISKRSLVCLINLV